ncbi:MAG: hypothetical protein DVS81_20270 [Candidatus Accumulibacter meliphilus]|uniref:Uncharacterized protein n=1 Tax=Candidatus Accumulibacter meliphilus TaxID=2211374 RepID=A0A369XF96_9PROT|nr:MAG: hypothetical protein DVS81_20270 [Candidatus Accumulibacter meliphilus]
MNDVGIDKRISEHEDVTVARVISINHLVEVSVDEQKMAVGRKRCLRWLWLVPATKISIIWKKTLQRAGLKVLDEDVALRFITLVLVESRCDAVAVGPTCLLPPLSSGGAQVVRP